MIWFGLLTVVSVLLAVSGQKSCSPGFTNYWTFGCYKVDRTYRGSGNWSDSEAKCQEYGPNVHLVGMESMEEMTAVIEAVKNIGTAWYWLGGKYNSTSGKYYWVGSGEDVDAAMFQSLTPTDLSNRNLVLMPTWGEINAYLSYSAYAILCEEY